VIVKDTIRFATVLLSVLSGSLLVLLVIIARWGETRVHAPEHVSARHLAEPDLSLLNPSAAANVDVTAIRENAVFYSHRAFFQPPPPGESIPVPEYDFAGSMGLPQGKRLAFVKRKSDRSNRTVHVGDDLDGWHVESIDAQRVVIVKDGKQIELKSANESGGSGLVRGTVTPYVAESGLKAIVGNTAAVHPPQAASHAARTYQPPPQN
jgi:hypothetical protein